MALFKTNLSTKVVMGMNLKNKKALKNIGIVLAVVIALYLVLHLFSKSSPPQIPLVKVVVQKPERAEVVEYVTQTGTTVAFNSVDLVARIEGYLDANKFTDGSLVTKGQELFVIQPEPYLEKLKEAQASVAAQKADYAYSKSEYSRQQKMYKENATSLNNVEKWLAKTQASEAEVAKAIANEAIATINYSYTNVKAPFSGRIGRHLVDVGNLVGNGKATNLGNIEQIDPIYVYFNLNELDLIKLRAAAKQHGIEPNDINQIPAFIKMQNETGYPHQGKLDFVNTGLNASTGTMEFRAILENKNLILVPGLFVQVRIPITKPQSQFVVPDSAVLYDQIGSYLLSVNNANEVEVKRVELGAEEKGKRTILKGITAEDKIIISGLQYAIPGNKVDPREQPTQPNETKH